jgi:hypothetical protein
MELQIMVLKELNICMEKNENFRNFMKKKIEKEKKLKPSEKSCAYSYLKRSLRCAGILLFRGWRSISNCAELSKSFVAIFSNKSHKFEISFFSNSSTSPQSNTTNCGVHPSENLHSDSGYFEVNGFLEHLQIRERTNIFPG